MMTTEEKAELKMIGTKIKTLAMKYWYIPVAIVGGLVYYFKMNKNSWK